MKVLTSKQWIWAGAGLIGGAGLVTPAIGLKPPVCHHFISRFIRILLNQAGMQSLDWDNYR